MKGEGFIVSWVDACRAAFKVKADALIFRATKNLKSPGRHRIITQLSKESGIPMAVLKRWYYEKEQERITGKPFNMPICRKCNKRPVEIISHCINPARLTESVNSAGGFCSTCARRHRLKKQKKGE